MQYVCHYVREYIFVWRETLILWLTDGVASKGVHTTCTPTEITQWQAEGYYFCPVWRQKSCKESIVHISYTCT